jgi:hypothetical protein
MAKATTKEAEPPVVTPPPTEQPPVTPPAPAPVGDIENVHDAKALMTQRLNEKYTKAIIDTGRYDEQLALQEQERLYQKKLIDSGAIGRSPADEAAVKASQEYEVAARKIAQFDPSQKESMDMAAEILGEDVSKLKTDKMIEGMAPAKGKPPKP